MDVLLNYLADTGFAQFHWTNGVMLLIGGLFIFLAIAKKFEPLLLVPIGFGILIGNVPYDTSGLSLGVYDGPVSEEEVAYFEFTDGQTWDGSPGILPDMQRLPHASRHLGEALVHEGRAIMVNKHTSFRPAASSLQEAQAQVIDIGQGRRILVSELTKDDSHRYPQVWSSEKQDIFNASVFWWLFAGVGLAGFYPPLIFLGVGALTDFGPMLANPKTLLLGAAAQFGIFAALIGATALPIFNLNEAASIGIIGGADGPTAIFTCAQLAPHLLGAVALAAYSYMAMVPIIQPPIMRLLTTSAERKIRMEQLAPVSKRVRILFPIVCFLVTAFIAPGGLPLLGMLFFGNLLRECAVADRLSKTAQTTFIDIVTILLGITVGAKTSAANFLTVQTLSIFVLGIIAFAIATATGVLAAKLMNKLTKTPVNPLIGAAGVSAVPMAARVAHTVGQEEDPQNYLLMHAMGPNVAGVIGSAVAAGVLLSWLS
ncbi:MAG: sodium ion-translocating decarboxylase subunit beta [Planctomycetota bacterium]